MEKCELKGILVQGFDHLDCVILYFQELSEWLIWMEFQINENLHGESEIIVIICIVLGDGWILEGIYVLQMTLSGNLHKFQSMEFKTT